jgi:hypothetical protein
MKSAVGLWIDHSQASIVMLSADGEKTEHIRSDIEKHVRFSGGSRFDGPGTSLEEDNKTGALETNSANTTTRSSRLFARQKRF